MIEIIKKTLLTGIGIAALSKEKLEELASDLAEKGRMSEQEGKELVQQLKSSSEEARQEMQKQIEGIVKTTLDRMDLARKSEVEKLRNELEELRKSIPVKE